MRKSLFYLISVILFCSCAKKAMVFSSEKMKDVQFDKYKTYAFLPTTDTSYAKLVNRKVLIPLMAAEVKKQLDSKGLVLDTVNPDCLFTYQMVMKRDYTFSQEKITDYNAQVLAPGEIPVNNAYGGVSGGTYMRTSTDPASNIYYFSRDNKPFTYKGQMQIDTLREGSLVIDMIDAKTKEIVWRSAVKGKKQEAAMMTPQEATQYYIPKMLKKLPRK